MLVSMYSEKKLAWSQRVESLFKSRFDSFHYTYYYLEVRKFSRLLTDTLELKSTAMFTANDMI